MRLGCITAFRIVLLFVVGISIAESFQARWPCVRNYDRSENRWEMAKGFNKARGKQAELAKKMELAKKQKQSDKSALEVEKPVTENSDQGARDNDMQEFQRLLDSTKGAIPTGFDTESAFIAQIKVGQKKVKQKRKPPPAPRVKQETKDTKEEIREAQRIHFESLIDIESSRELGGIGAAKLVPWVPPFLNDCLIVFADPRTNSGGLRQTIKYLASVCSHSEEDDSDEDKRRKQKIVDQVIFITADPVPEMQAWLKRSKVLSPIPIFSDPQLDWMSQYKVLSVKNDDEGGAKFPWSMALLNFDTNGELTVRKRKVEPSHSTQLVLDIINDLSKKK